MDKGSKVIIWVVAIVVIIGGGWLIYSGSNKSPTETGPITIGFIGALTGDAASIGTVDKAAVEVAIGEINNGGGVGGRQLNVIYEDGQCASTPANNAASKLIDVDKVPIIVGGLCSGETAAFAPHAMQSKVVVFSY